jgi:hypothetical protein
MSEDLWPTMSVVCPLCDAELEVPSGLNAADILWMHEHDCLAQILGEDYTPSWREVA